MDKLYGNQREAILIGYLAGIFDGEGTVAIKKTKPNPKFKIKNIRYEGALSIGMAYKPIVQLFADRYGGKIREECVPGRRIIYRWAKVGNEGVRKILEELVPFLIEKRERAELLLEYYDTIDTTKYRANGRVLPTSDEELAKRMDFYLRMKELQAWQAPATTNRESIREDEVIV